MTTETPPVSDLDTIRPTGIEKWISTHRAAVRAGRAILQLGQEEMARMCQVSRPTINRIETGRACGVISMVKVLDTLAEKGVHVIPSGDEIRVIYRP